MNRSKRIREANSFMNEKNYFEAEYQYIKEIADRYQLTFPEAVEFVKLCVMNKQAQILYEQETRLLDINSNIACLR